MRRVNSEIIKLVYGFANEDFDIFLNGYIFAPLRGSKLSFSHPYFRVFRRKI